MSCPVFHRSILHGLAIDKGTDIKVRTGASRCRGESLSTLNSNIQYGRYPESGFCSCVRSPDLCRQLILHSELYAHKGCTRVLSMCIFCHAYLLAYAVSGTDTQAIPTSPAGSGPPGNEIRRPTRQAGFPSAKYFQFSNVRPTSPDSCLCIESTITYT